MPTNVTPVQPPARELREQVSHVIRKTVNFDDANLASGVALPASLPAGALITSVLVLVEVAFNAGTTNPLTLGTTPTGNDVAAATDTVAQTVGVKRIDTGTLKGRLAADSPLYVAYVPTGAAPTAGRATIVVFYVPNNDG